MIQRSGANVFEGKITLKQMKRELPELAGWLFKELSFPDGCFLMTGTGIIPPDHFTLAHGDVVNISIEGIGMLSNTVKIST
jgi:2-dehydro-3-deoxy-D-arabinonate dehydratase